MVVDPARAQAALALVPEAGADTGSAPMRMPEISMPPMPVGMALAANGTEGLGSTQPGPDGLGRGLGQTGPDDAHTLGLSILLAGIGAAVGLAYGGPFGAVAGSLYGGAVSNAFRAARNVASGTEEADREARISATYMVLSAGAATYIVWKIRPKADEKRDR